MTTIVSAHNTKAAAQQAAEFLTQQNVIAFYYETWLESSDGTVVPGTRRWEVEVEIKAEDE